MKEWQKLDGTACATSPYKTNRFFCLPLLCSAKASCRSFLVGGVWSMRRVANRLLAVGYELNRGDHLRGKKSNRP